MNNWSSWTGLRLSWTGQDHSVHSLRVIRLTCSKFQLQGILIDGYCGLTKICSAMETAALNIKFKWTFFLYTHKKILSFRYIRSRHPKKREEITFFVLKLIKALNFCCFLLVFAHHMKFKLLLLGTVLHLRNTSAPAPCMCVKECVRNRRKFYKLWIILTRTWNIEIWWE